MSRDQEIDPEEEARLTALQKEMMKKVDTTVKVDHVRYVAGCDATSWRSEKARRCLSACASAGKSVLTSR